MPKLDADTTRAARAGLLLLLRLTAAVLMAWGLVTIGTRFTQALLNPANFTEYLFKVWSGTGETHGVFRGVPILLVGFTLAVLSRWATHWMIPAPETGCLHCNQPLPPASPQEEPRCTECGTLQP